MTRTETIIATILVTIALAVPAYLSTHAMTLAKQHAHYTQDKHQ